MVKNPLQLALLDVRSEGEFQQGNFPLSKNVPILDNLQRHQVGLCYRESGQASAIQLGHHLVDASREGLVREWKSSLGFSPSALGLVNKRLVYCWRGGLRSKIACDWMLDAGLEVIRIEGGYKGLRREVLNVFMNYPRFIVLGGLTGSGKTRMLRLLNNSLNLEDLARHRGSSFGSFYGKSQPSQSSFENSLALQLVGRDRGNRIAIEDESPRIGKVMMPDSMYTCLANSPFVYLDLDISTRSENIFVEYVSEPMKNGIHSSALCQLLIESTMRLQKRLGGLLTSEIVRKISQAFDGEDHELHLVWIKKLLVEYYDRRYKWAMEKKNLLPVFFGGWEACLAYLKSLEKQGY
ncbi:MAG: tRNA 2-selenouridine(34) synthase MnmH [Bdellovibrionales bacterium]|nr:tRNA 2-selenouridine(34) synthase MnmH [Bdellovibrionales bacterium]